MLDTTRVTEQLAKARAFAKQHGLTDQLEGQLRYLDTYRDGQSRCTLSADFAPHSFGFCLEGRKADGPYEHWFSGGLIFHGPNGGRGAAPEYSVSLVPTIGWSVNT